MKFKLKDTKDMGRGLFAIKDLKKNEIVEVSPIVLIPEVEANCAISKTILTSYVFRWDAEYTGLALGYGSLFNHSFEPNVTYVNDFKNTTIKFKAQHSIKKGEQLFINYGYAPEYAQQILNRLTSSYSKPLTIAPIKHDLDNDVKAKL